MNYAFAGHAALMGSYHPEETHLDKWVKWLRNGYRKLIDILEQQGKPLRPAPAP
ncbi:protease FtsH-inhibitory lysogeny factor CIII [Symbiopectobacterium sp. RP]|uniref:protease FtsH-inhibitory lysogeny factor CIII n=1 Tax=Symbiopectobacterium sp. RP TaxID=3248553 RepID=UPI003D288E08